VETVAVVDLFSQKLSVINIGVPLFAEDLSRQGHQVLQVEWSPPAGGNIELLTSLEKLSTPEVEEANRRAFERITQAHPYLEGIGIAREWIPGMQDKYMLLHAGPPITWSRMSGPLRGAILGAILYEGWAATPEEAETLASSDKMLYGPCHEHDTVGPMAGVVSPSMPVFKIRNRVHGNVAYCTINEGLGKVLRFGAYSQEVLERLRWIEARLAPVLKKTLELIGGIDLKSIIAQTLHMGDESHNRNKAGTSLVFRALAPYLLETGFEPPQLAECLKFINGNDHFFLNLSMPTCKAVLDSALGIPNSTLVTTMTRNGTDFGIRVSGTGDRWFTAPANMVNGLYFPGYSVKDANPDIGDSAITETAGIGGFAMAAAPAIVQFVGGTSEDALEYTKLMYQITQGENLMYSIPTLNFRGTPTGIDVRKVIELGVLPMINTGIAHKDPGIGQVGAGLVKPPRECFEQALLALSQVKSLGSLGSN
jgi:hypothetical protein